MVAIVAEKSADFRQYRRRMFHRQEVAAQAHRLDLRPGDQFLKAADAGILRSLRAGIVAQQQQKIPRQALQVTGYRQFIPLLVKDGFYGRGAFNSARPSGKQRTPPSMKA